MSGLIPLGRTDVMVSRLGIGVMTWGEKAFMTAYGGTAGREDEAHALEAGLAGGINFYDTAEMYGSGNSERSLGVLARGKDLVIASKFMPRPPRTSASLPGALDATLARLGMPRLDLYQIHFPVPWIRLGKLMDRLAEAVRAGKVRAVGVSNYSVAQTREAHDRLAQHGIPLASNQVQYSLLYRNPEANGVLAACRELGVTLIAYSPLAMGALTGKYRPGVTPTDLMRRRLSSQFKPKALQAIAPVVARLEEIAATHGKTPGQVALRWLIENGALPIPGAKNAEQATQNAGALSFSLSAGEVDALREVSQPFLQGRR
jgi:aryl-alcohol dehydrogenase-like predicted oxidoreductase